MRSRRSILVVAVLVVLALVLAIPAFAGNGKGRGQASATLTVQQMGPGFSALASGDSVPYGWDLMVSGENYRPNAPVFVVFGEGLPSQLVQADKAGTFSFEWLPETGGTYALKAYQRLNNGKWVMAAETAVTVE
jgi:hypothetical protein